MIVIQLCLRYPISMDKNLDYQKSTFKKCNLVKGKLQRVRKVNQNLKIFLLVHSGNDEIIESYVSGCKYQVLE